jgi:hypothetical protein
MWREVFPLLAFSAKKKKGELWSDGHTGVNTTRFVLLCHARTQKFHIAFLGPRLMTITVEKSFFSEGNFLM